MFTIPTTYGMRACTIHYLVFWHWISKHLSSAETRKKYGIITEYRCIAMRNSTRFILVKPSQQRLLHVIPYNCSEMLGRCTIIAYFRCEPAGQSCLLGYNIYEFKNSMLSIKYISTINMYFLYRYAVLERRANHEYQQTANKWLTSEFDSTLSFELSTSSEIIRLRYLYCFVYRGAFQKRIWALKSKSS